MEAATFRREQDAHGGGELADGVEEIAKSELVGFSSIWRTRASRRCAPNPAPGSLSMANW